MSLSNILSKKLSKISSISMKNKFIFILVLLISHLWLSYEFKDFTWLSSFGGFVTVFGVIILFNYTFPDEGSPDLPPRFPLRKTEHGYVEIIDGSLDWEVEDQTAQGMILEYNIKLDLYRDSLLSKRQRILSSFVSTIIGTLIWAYAGYLNLVFFPSCT